jgi:hypothetical protein
MTHDVYICSKPLQYFNIRNIKRSGTREKDVLIFLNSFIDAPIFVDRVKEYDLSWGKVNLLKNRFSFYKYLFFHHADSIYVELDSTFFYGLLKVLGCFKHMFLFEEGFGSYRRDRCRKAHGLKKWINKLTGVSDYVGESKFLEGIYLYMPDLYHQQLPENDKRLIPFAAPFVQHLKDELPLFLKLSDGYEDFLHIKQKKIGIYLTSHQIKPEIIKRLIEDRNQFDILLLKPHPHLKNIDIDTQYNVQIVRSNVMMEFLLIILLSNQNKLSVYHENSTAVIWFQDLIDNRNVGPVFEEYNIVASYIKSLNTTSNNKEYVKQ